MRVAIISAGPSAKHTWQGGDYRTIIAVNQGLSAFDADYLVCGDARCVLAQLGDRSPRIGIWTMKDEDQHARELRPGLPVDRFDLLPAITELPRPFNWSIQGALAVALHLGATEVDCYGCDMQPGPDLGGKPGDDRTDERWERERNDIADSISYLNRHGCLVRRIMPF